MQFRAFLQNRQLGSRIWKTKGMEKYNTLEGNLGVGAIPLLSGMLESDQELAEGAGAAVVTSSGNFTGPIQ